MYTSSQCLATAQRELPTPELVYHLPAWLATQSGRTEPVELHSRCADLRLQARQLTFTIPILALSVLSTTMMTAWEAL